MRVQSILFTAAALAAAPAVAGTGTDAVPPAAETGAPAITQCAADSVPAPAPRRRRGLGGLLRAVGSSGAVAFIPGLGMAGQIANLAAGTAAQVSAEDAQRQATQDATQQANAALQLEQCQAAAVAPVASGG